MAGTIYKFVGDRKKGFHTGAIDTKDANDVRRFVPRDGTIELTPAQFADLNNYLVLIPDGSPVPTAPISEHEVKYSELIDPATGKILAPLLPAPSVPTVVKPGIGDLIRDYGAKGDGVSDDTAAIQQAIDDGFALIPRGHMFRFSQLVMKKDSILAGQGWGSVLKQLDNVNADGIHTVANGTGWWIRDLTLDGNQEGNTAGSGIHPAEVAWNAPGIGVLSGSWFQIFNVCSQFWSGHGFDMSGLFGGYHVSHCLAFENEGHGFNVIMGDSVYTACESAQNTGHGYFIDGHVSSFAQCKAWWNGRKQGRGVAVSQAYGAGVGTSDGFHVTSNARMSLLTGCDSQDNTRDGIALGARALSVVGGFVDNNARYNLNTQATGGNAFDSIVEGLILGYGGRIGATAHVNLVADQRNRVSASRPGGAAPFLAGDPGGNSIRIGREVPRFVNTPGEPGWGAGFAMPAATHTSLHFWNEDGEVRLGGHAWVAALVAANSTIFTLPNLPEYRPVKATESAACSTAGTTIIVKINPNGTVTNSTAIPANSFMCFNGVRARTGAVQTPPA